MPPRSQGLLGMDCPSQARDLPWSPHWSVCECLLWSPSVAHEYDLLQAAQTVLRWLHGGSGHLRFLLLELKTLLRLTLHPKCHTEAALFKFVLFLQLLCLVGQLQPWLILLQAHPSRIQSQSLEQGDTAQSNRLVLEFEKFEKSSCLRVWPALVLSTQCFS